MKDELISIKIDNMKNNFIIFQEDEKRLSDITTSHKPVVNILPILDTYIMGYKERNRYLNQKNYYFIFDRSGNATNTIILNGHVIGIWDIDEPYIKMFLLINIQTRIKKIITDKLIKIGIFYTDKKLKIKECKSMIPLNKRTAGSVMKPLKT